MIRAVDSARPARAAWSTVDTSRADIHADFKRTAQAGFVPADALIGRLYASHLDTLAEDRRRLGDLEQELAGRLRRLDAAYPAPPLPEPEKPEPPRARRFGLMSDTWAKQGTETRH